MFWNPDDRFRYPVLATRRSSGPSSISPHRRVWHQQPASTRQQVPVMSPASTGLPVTMSDAVEEAAPPEDTQAREQAERRQRRADDALAAEKRRLVQEFLPVLDNLQRALAHEDQNSETLRQGLELVERQFRQVLARSGVEPMTSLGQPFDPQLQEAVATVPAPAAAGLVIDELEKGYTLEGKLLRPGKVVVGQDINPA